MHSWKVSGWHTLPSKFQIKTTALALWGWSWDDCGTRRRLSLSRRACYGIIKAALVMQSHGSTKWLHMNASEPLIYYNLIVGEAFERENGCNSISVHASPKVQKLWGGACRVPAATLTSVSLGGLLLNGPSCQLLTPLGFGPCGSSLQSQWLGSTSLVWWCSDEALITSKEYRSIAADL